MKRLKAISFTMTLSAFCLAACGGGGGIKSGVDEAKQANEVTDDEAEDICEATQDYAASKVDDQQEVGCRGVGFTAGLLMAASGDDAMQEACDEAYDTCLEAEPEESTCAGSTADTLDCDDTVTVGDVQSCLQDRIDNGVAAIDLIPTCSELTLEYLTELAEDPPEEVEDPASCEVVVDGCPGFDTTG